MTDPNSSPHLSSSSWAEQIVERYRLASIPDDLAAWFDEEIWMEHPAGEYRLPVPPAALLDDQPECIWPALMPPDFLPVIGNGLGDWLCLRFDNNNRIGEIVQWYHGGGDWIPWGQTLAEALLLNAAFHRLPGPRRRHAAPAVEHSAPELSPRSLRVGWLDEHLPAPAVQLVKENESQRDIASAFVEAGVAEVAVRCEMIQAILASPMRNFDPAVAKSAGWSRRQLLEWSFDTSRIPETEQKLAAAVFGNDVLKPQDWGAVAEHCRKVIDIDDELAWPWDLLGFHAERKGSVNEAIDLYQIGITKPVFTNQSVRLGTHWYGDQPVKFSAAMLKRLSSKSFEGSTYLEALCRGEPALRPARITRYWLEKSETAASKGDVAAAHEFAVSAGWDVGAHPLDAYAELLDRVAASASEAGYKARAELARTHRRCLQSRYCL